MMISVLRTVILYFMVILSLRLMGKRQIGELEPSELVVTIMISELATIPMQETGAPLMKGLFPILALLTLEIFLSAFLMKSIRFRKLLCGKPSLVIENGKVIQKELKKNRLTIDELIEELRFQSVTDISTVQYGVLETNGQLSIILYAAERPAKAGETATDLGGLPVIIVNDGRLMTYNMRKKGITEKWLSSELKSRGADSIRDVYLFMVDERNNIYYLPKEMKR